MKFIQAHYDTMNLNNCENIDRIYNAENACTTNAAAKKVHTLVGLSPVLVPKTKYALFFMLKLELKLELREPVNGQIQATPVTEF